MPRPIKLSIPKPCDENWDAMQPAGNGRHCAACQKTVVDFTTMSDGEIIRHLGKSTANGRTAPVCGRFMADQLNRRLIPPSPLGGAFRRRGWQWVLTSLLLISDEPVSHRTRPPLTEQRVPDQRTERLEDIFVGTMAFNGVRRHPSSEPKPDTATVSVKGEIMGDFELLPVDTAITMPDTLLRPAFLPSADTSAVVDSPVVVGGVDVITRDNVNALPDSTVAADSQFSISEKLVVESTTISGLRIYPNPVPRGTSSWIAWSGAPAGSYQLILFNTSGALLDERRIEITAAHQVTEFRFPPGLAAGIYWLHASRGDQQPFYNLKIQIN